MQKRGGWNGKEKGREGLATVIGEGGQRGEGEGKRERPGRNGVERRV